MWQSIIAGLSTFKRGYIWRVGNGENIKIWEDLDPLKPYMKPHIRKRSSGVYKS
jgi:hypothetical protein